MDSVREALTDEYNELWRSSELSCGVQQRIYKPEYKFVLHQIFLDENFFYCKCELSTVLDVAIILPPNQMKESDEDVTVQPECNLRFEIFGELTRKCGLQWVVGHSNGWIRME